MDQLDAALLREMLRGRVLLWGGLDPRVGAGELAARLGVDRTTVWSRLRAWRRSGFLVRQEVVPSPALFGAGLAVGDIRVDDPRRKADVLGSLALVEGVLAGTDQVGPFVLLLYAHDTPAGLQRCTRLVAQLPGVDEVSMCVPFDPPARGLDPTSTDWRILRALRRLPDRPLREVAGEAGVSPRTVTRRYAELLQAHALWSFPILDFGRYRDAVFTRFVVALADARRVPEVVNAAQRELRELVWWDAPPPAAGSTGEAWVDLYGHLACAADVEEVQRWLLDLPGVEAVEPYFPKSWFVNPAWFDERIDGRLRTLAHAGRGG